MTKIAHPYRVLHFPQIPGPGYIAPARTYDEACAIAENLGLQHLWLLEQNIIPDYSNIIAIEVWDGEEWEEVDESELTDLAANAYTEFADAVKKGKP